ncbi:MAG: hypothetical protein LRY54_03420 [Alphaproteobacteria bacterium]|nr:hypothetical protein [Alphaproteobacteria bacterium]
MTQSLAPFFEQSRPAPEAVRDDILKEALTVFPIQNNILPAGIVSFENPLTPHDYVMADRMNQAALDRILFDIACKKRGKMAPGARLYIVVGEAHKMPAHRMVQAGLIDNLAAASRSGAGGHGSLLFAQELPYNYLQFYARNIYGLSVDKAVQERLHEYDPLGRNFMKAVLADNRFVNMAPQSLARVFSRCLAQDVPLALIDAAQDQSQNYLSPSDALACEVAEDIYEGLDLGQEQIPLSPFFGRDKNRIDNRGMVIRNAVMARRAVEAAEEHRADTIVTATGAMHLGGNVAEFRKNDTSFITFLKEEIRPQDKILPIFIAAGTQGLTAEESIPGDFWEDNPEAVILRGASEAFYPPVLGDLGIILGLCSCPEPAFLERLGRSYGDAVPARFHETACLEKEAMTRELEEIIRLAQPAPA